MLEDNKYSIFKYDTEKFNFRKIFSDFAYNNIGLDLENIHKTDINKLVPSEILKTGEDSKQPFCELFYNIDDEFDSFDKKFKLKIKKNNNFMSLYRNFVKELKQQYFGESIVYQKKPTIRVHLPKNVSTGSYHRDSEYGHSEKEINFWLPLTDAKKTSALHIESEYMSENFLPVEVKYGEFLIFNSLLKHGTEVNQEGSTRISFDFRIMKTSEYEGSDKKSFVRRKQFKIGSYYEQL